MQNTEYHYHTCFGYKIYKSISWITRRKKKRTKNDFFVTKILVKEELSPIGSINRTMHKDMWVPSLHFPNTSFYPFFCMKCCQTCISGQLYLGITCL